MQKPRPNHLSGAESPYLLQHSYNPVDWYPWGDEALTKARHENKLLVISIGYAACHWCHVMERESFEDPEVASVMNEWYVSVKVDREERPDIDQVYMYASYVVTGRGGWPLNVIALPDGRPVYAGTYFRKSDWIYILKELSEIYRNNPEELTRQAEDIHRKMEEIDKPDPVRAAYPVEAPRTSPEKVNNPVRSMKTDPVNGGFEGAPKFPMPVCLEYLMQFAFLTANREAYDATERSLDRMAAGGIFDHLGGGFARYSTDERWHIPHFEKMLYDNAQLLSLYSHGFQLFRKPEYEQAIRLTAAFISRELTSPDGLFYASLDADSDGTEGAFYRWKSEEIKEHAGENYLLFRDHFGIDDEGNWENGWNVLHKVTPLKDLCVKYSLSEEIAADKIENICRTLFAVHEKRNHPALDNKIITSWNGMMISGYVNASLALGDEVLIGKAEKAALLLSEHAISPDGKTARTGVFPLSGQQKNRISGFLDDYAFLILAFTDLYEATFNPRWLQDAEKVALYAVSHFFDERKGLFYFTSDEDPNLVSRRMELSDNVIPSSNSVMACNLYRLGYLLGKGKWVALAEKMSGHLSSKILQNPGFFANWGILALHLAIPGFEVSIVGENWKNTTRLLRENYLPHVIFSGGADDKSLDILKGKNIPGKTLAYICSGNTCSEPLEDPGIILSRINKNIVSLKHK